MYPRKLAELNGSHISAYLLTLRGHAKSTLRCELSRLRKFLSYLYLLGYTSENLAPHVPEYRLGQAQSIIKIWESDEINAVLDTVNRASPKGKRDYAFITIAAELGVRSKDICDLKLSDIDWDLRFPLCKARRASRTRFLSAKKWDWPLLTICAFVRRQSANICLSV